MLRPWARRILIGLAPDGLTALCVSGWLRPRLLDRHRVPLPPPHHGSWKEALRELGVLLDEPSWHDQRIAVVLSSHYVRHIVVPAARGLSTTERNALAGAVFRDTFGEASSDWEIRLSPGAGLAPTVACGIPHGLLSELHGVCDSRGRLESIRPSLMPIFNRARRLIRRSAGCLAIVEAGRLTLALVQDGRWLSILSRAADGQSLPHLLQEEGELYGRQPGGILWLCDINGGARLPIGTTWSLKRIEPPHLPGMDEVSDLANWGLM